MSDISGAVRKAAVVRAIPLLLIAGLGWQFVIAPRLAEPDAIAAQTVETLNQAQLMESKAEAPDAAQAQYDAATAIAGQLTQRYPDEPLPAGLTEAVKKAAEEAGIAPGTVLPVVTEDPVIGGQPAAGATPAPSPSPAASGGAGTTPAAAASYATVTFSTAVTGTPEQVEVFINRLVRQGRGIFVTSVAVADAEPIVDPVTQESRPSGKVTATVQCVSMLLKQVLDPTAQDKESPTPSPSPSAN